MKIAEQMYSSTKDFVFLNGLIDQANELFGEGWENEDDCYQIEQLLEHINTPFYEVEFIEGLRNKNEDIKVWFNSAMEELDRYKKGFDIVMEYFNYIPTEDKEEVHIRLENLKL